MPHAVKCNVSEDLACFDQWQSFPALSKFKLTSRAFTDIADFKNDRTTNHTIQCGSRTRQVGTIHTFTDQKGQDSNYHGVLRTNNYYGKIEGEGVPDDDDSSGCVWWGLWDSTAIVPPLLLWGGCLQYGAAREHSPPSWTQHLWASFSQNAGK